MLWLCCGGKLVALIPAEDELSAGGEGVSLEEGLEGLHPSNPDEAAMETLTPDGLRQAVLARASPPHLWLP